jgi:hypothetical protein
MPKKVSLKHIIAEIDKALEQLGPGTQGAKPGDEQIDRARKGLKGVRETVEAICLPNFEVPAS